MDGNAISSVEMPRGVIYSQLGSHFNGELYSGIEMSLYLVIDFHGLVTIPIGSNEFREAPIPWATVAADGESRSNIGGRPAPYRIRRLIRQVVGLVSAPPPRPPGMGERHVPPPPVFARCRWR